ncbi:DUF3617 domain-containing protein [Sphingomicrobium arenosum]|uniref:DUF3617 domain-containing protein n=1 Tax=Sphingomicrobium arenosum TaxID=2233861 RepID=UPI002240EE53|nr:DUF3617 family protein [Sphingomicrobium arenosum]
MRTLPLLAAAALAAPLAAAAPTPQPGLWTVEARVVSVDSQNVPALVRRMVEGRVETYERCLTPAQARGQFERLLVQEEARCSFSEARFAGGAMRVKGRCTSDKGDMTLDLSGTHSGTGFRATNKMTLTGRLGTVDVTAAHVGTRKGRC